MNRNIAQAMNAKQQQKIIDVCSILARQENLTVTIHKSGKGALIAGIGTFVGGLCGGPAGMAVGGTLSSLAAAYAFRGQFKSVVEILDEMTNDEKRRLCEAVKKVLTDIRPEDWMGVLKLVVQNGSAKELVLRELGSFLMKEFEAKMIR